MNRRQLLAAIGSGATVSLVGCLSSPQDRTESPTPAPTTDVPTTPPPGSTDPRWDPQSASPFESITVGTRASVAFPENHRPITVRVWNAAPEPRTFSLTLATAETTRMGTEVTVPADGWLEMTVNEPGQYTLSVGIDGESVGEVSVGPFDCNQTRTSVIVDASGNVTEQILSTEIACAGPAIAGQSLTFEAGSCDATETSAVDFEDEAVTVTGRIRAPDPCYEVSLAAVTLQGDETIGYDSTEVLVVTVTTADPGDSECVQCVGSVPYRATVAFEHDYPPAVRVIHESMDERRTVETVER